MSAGRVRSERWMIARGLALVAAGCALFAACSSGDGGDTGPGGDGGSGGTAAYAPRLEPVPCRWELPAAHVEGETIRCADLVVPQDRARLEAGELRVHLARLPASAPRAGAAPIVVLGGGPGAHTRVFPLEPAIVELVAGGRECVYLEQRGVGTSDPALECPELDALVPDGDATDEELLAAVASCRQRLEAAGARPGAYHTVASADDVEDLRRALGAPKLALWAVSYGTRLGLEVLRRHGTGVEEIILDSVLPPQHQQELTSLHALEASLENVFAACAASAGCAAAYPDVEGTFSRVYARLEAAPAPLDGGSLDGDELVRILGVAAYSPPLLAVVPRALAELDAGRVAEGVALLRPAAGDPLGAAVTSGLFLSVHCADAFAAQSAEARGALDASLRPELREAARTSAAARAARACSAWHDVVPPPELLDPVRWDGPALVVAGAFDPVTPPSWSEEAAAALPGSVLVRFAGGSHTPTGTGLCGFGIASAFLEDPAAALDAGCAEANLVLDVP